MTRDRIVDEVRAARKKILESAGGTIDGLFEWLNEQERIRKLGAKRAARKRGSPPKPRARRKRTR